MWKIGVDPKHSSVLHDQQACNVCSKGHDFNIDVVQEYLVIYGLRLFPLKKKHYSTCQQCDRRQQISLTDRNNLLDVRYIGITDPPYSKFKYYTGWIVIGLVVSFIFYLYFKYA